MKDQENPPALYIVATPIGNLEDFSARAKAILNQVDWIAAEDTRESAKLLLANDIQKPVISFHEHSKSEKVEELIAKLKAGERGAYVSDAGTPGISDPGAALVRACHEAAIRVVPIPGASAVSTLLSASGFAATHFEFHGFFPREHKERKAWCLKIEKSGGVHLFFESPHRVQECLKILAEKFPDFPLIMGRELTKRFETVTLSTPKKMAEFYTKEEPRGEFAFGIHLPDPEMGDAIPRKSEPEIAEFLASLVTLGGNQKLLVAVAKELGIAKNDAYDLVLKVLGK